MPRPTEWTWARPSELTLPTQTWNPHSEPRELIRYVDVSAISKEELRILDSLSIPATPAPSRARKLVRDGDTIFATVRPTLKRIAKIPASLAGKIVSTAFCVLPKSGKGDFLFFAVQLDAVMAEIAALETGASYPAVRESDLLDQVIAVPLLSEQFSIATVLNAARTAFLHETECEAVSVALKQAAMRDLFTRGLRGEAQKETEIGPVPESWEIAPLEHCAFVQTGTAKGRKLGNAEIVEVPYLRRLRIFGQRDKLRADRSKRGEKWA
jgi:type I restriction enzyme, S subunit